MSIIIRFSFGLFCCVLGEIWTASFIGAVIQPANAQEATRQQTRAAVIAALYGHDAEKLRQAITPELIKEDIQPPLLTLAAESGNAITIAILVGAGADIDQIDATTGATALMAAAKFGNTETARALLALGARTDIVGPSGETYQSLAEQSGLASAASASPAKPASPSPAQPSAEDMGRALRAAAAEVDHKRVEALLELGASVDGQDPDGRTALMYAAFGDSSASSRLATIDHLLRAGADAKATDNGGNTALAFAIIGKAPAQVIDALKRVSKLNHKNDELLGYWEIASRAQNKMALKRLPLPFVLNSSPPNVPEFDPLIKAHMTTSDWIKTQEKLASLGLYDAAIDGLAGPRTHRALIAYLEPQLSSFAARVRAFCQASTDNILDSFTSLPDGTHSIETASGLQKIVFQGDETTTRADFANLSVLFQRYGKHITIIETQQKSDFIYCNHGNFDERLLPKRPQVNYIDLKINSKYRLSIWINTNGFMCGGDRFLQDKNVFNYLLSDFPSLKDPAVMSKMRNGEPSGSLLYSGIGIYKTSGCKKMKYSGVPLKLPSKLFEAHEVELTKWRIH